MAVLPKREWIDFSHEMIHHGRQICIARRPKCDECPLERLCPKIGVETPRPDATGCKGNCSATIHLTTSTAACA